MEAEGADNVEEIEGSISESSNSSAPTPEYTQTDFLRIQKVLKKLSNKFNDSQKGFQDFEESWKEVI